VKVAGAVFDFDGALVDSNDVKRRACFEAAGSRGGSAGAGLPDLHGLESEIETLLESAP
jgi:phosphoglycolate phosphatase-like HAD superfamily hydrolase